MKRSETIIFRENILNLIEKEPGTTAKVLADVLDVSQNNIYYHLKHLEKGEKVSITIQTTVNGINEKYYYPFKLASGTSEPLKIVLEKEQIHVEPMDKNQVKKSRTGDAESLSTEVIEEDIKSKQIKDLLSNEKVDISQIGTTDEVTSAEKENKFNVKKITDEIVDENLNVKNSGTDSSDDAATSLKNILMGTSPEKNEIQDDPPIKTQLDTSDEDEYDEVLIENIPFLVPKIYISLDDIVNKTHAKGERVIDLETQAKVFEYLKTNFSFDVSVNDPIELFDDETEEDKGEVVDLEDLDNGDSDKISVVKRIKNSLLMLARALTFKSYELAIQQSGNSLNVLFTQSTGDKLKLLYNKSMTIPVHQHMDVLYKQIDNILKKYNIKTSQVKVSVESDQVYTQDLEFEAPDIKKKEIEELIKIKIKRDLKLDADNTYFNFNVKKFSGTSTVYVKIADADPINNLIQFFKDKGLNIAYVSTLSTICTQLLNKTNGISKKSTMLLYLGYSRSNVLFIRDGNLIMQAQIGSSIADFLKKIKGSVHGGSKNLQIKESDIINLIETGAIYNENDKIFSDLNIPFITVKQLFEDFIKTIRNDMMLTLRQFQNTHTVKVKKGFLVSFLKTSDSLVKALSKEMKFNLQEIGISILFNKKDQGNVRDYFAIPVGLSVADKKEQNLLPKNIREKAIYMGRTKVLAAISFVVVALLVSALIFTFNSLKISEDTLASAKQHFDTNKSLYINSINFQKKTTMLDFIEMDFNNKVSATQNISRLISYLGNELPDGIKLNSLRSIPNDKQSSSKESIYPRRFEIEGFVTSDLSNALIILEGMREKLDDSNYIKLISFENSDFFEDRISNVPKQYFTIVCEL